EEPLAIEQLDKDPSLQRCPRCETRYRKGFHAHEL
ncbi:conjugal transfer protein TraR, partial [Aeromonas media]